MKPEIYFEFTTAEGLETVAVAELRHRFGEQLQIFYPPERFPGTVQFAYGGRISNLLQMKTVLSPFWYLRFQVPRPRALLGHQALTLILEHISQIRALWPKNAFNSFHLAAAGTESTVMRRIADEIAQNSNLKITQDEGDLLVRIRRPLDGKEGWEVGIRMSPRPLSVRPWRVCDLKGALNAAIAQAIVQFTNPRPEDLFLNLGCGSGTLLVERATSAAAQKIVGCDIDLAALECARRNIQAARLTIPIQLAEWDMRELPLADASFDVIASDLPFGHDVGNHKENIELYPTMLKEAARVARPGARCVLISHEIRLISSLLETSTDWVVQRLIPITITGLHPRIYILKKAVQ